MGPTEAEKMAAAEAAATVSRRSSRAWRRDVLWTLAAVGDRDALRVRVRHREEDRARWSSTATAVDKAAAVPPAVAAATSSAYEKSVATAFDTAAAVKRGPNARPRGLARPSNARVHRGARRRRRHAYASPASAASAETTARDVRITRDEKRDDFCRKARNARRETRARVFGASNSFSAAEETPAFSSVGAGVVVTEVVPANQNPGDRAFANALRSAFGNSTRKDETATGRKPRNRDERTARFARRTRLGFLRAEDEDERFSDCSVASLRADGSVATHADGRRARTDASRPSRRVSRPSTTPTTRAPRGNVADVAEKTT